MTTVEATPLAVVKEAVAAMEAKDYDTALTHFAEDCEYTNVPLATVRGPQGIRAVLEPFFAPTLENELLFTRVGVEGPVVFAERLDRHLVGERWVELPVAAVWEVREGKIAVWREYFDLETLFRQWPEIRPAAAA